MFLYVIQSHTRVHDTNTVWNTQLRGEGGGDQPHLNFDNLF